MNWSTDLFFGFHVLPTHSENREIFFSPKRILDSFMHENSTFFANKLVCIHFIHSFSQLFEENICELWDKEGNSVMQWAWFLANSFNWCLQWLKLGPESELSNVSFFQYSPARPVFLFFPGEIWNHALSKRINLYGACVQQLNMNTTCTFMAFESIY